MGVRRRPCAERGETLGRRTARAISPWRARPLALGVGLRVAPRSRDRVSAARASSSRKARNIAPTRRRSVRSEPDGLWSIRRGSRPGRRICPTAAARPNACPAADRAHRPGIIEPVGRPERGAGLRRGRDLRPPPDAGCRGAGAFFISEPARGRFQRRFLAAGSIPGTSSRPCGCRARRWRTFPLAWSAVPD